MRISGINLKHALQKAKIKQEDAALMLEISRPTLSVWYNKDVLTDDIIERVKSKLNIDLTNVKQDNTDVMDELITQFKQRLIDKDKMLHDKDEIIKLLKEKIKEKMKKLHLIFLILFSLSLQAQIKNPRLKNNVFVYKLDSLSTTTEKYNAFDELGVKEIIIDNWKNGFWSTTLKFATGDIKMVYASDVNFIKNYRYISEIKKYTNDKKYLNNDQLLIWQKAYGQKIGRNLFYEIPSIGMTTKMLIWCVGNPDKINSIETKGSYSSQWVYSSKYYYFTNGKLTAIQD